jgi:Prokaryotic N-terminal methylation motif
MSVSSFCAIRNRSGVTLVELLASVAIVGALLGLLLPAVQMVRGAAEHTEHLNWLRQRRLGEQPPRKRLKVVFVGNSKTYWNDIPGIVVELGKDFGVEVSTKVVVEGGQTLEGHWERGEAQNAILEDWSDFVVIQEQSNREYSEDEWPLYLDYATRLIQLCKRDSVPVIYSTWGFRDYAYLQPTITRRAFSIINEKENTHSEVCPVGEAWRCDPGPDLFDDDRHPSIYGAYLSACVFHAFFNCASPEGLKSSLTTKSGTQVDIDPGTARKLQKTAWETNRKFKEKNRPHYLRTK